MNVQILERLSPVYSQEVRIDNETVSKSAPQDRRSSASPAGPKVGKLIDMDSPSHHPHPSSTEELRPESQCSSKSTSGVCSGDSTHQGEQPLHTPGADSMQGTISTPGTGSTPGAEQGSSGSVTSSHQAADGQQTFNNQAYDDMSMAEHTTDVS